MKTGFSDILEVHQMNQIRTELDSLTAEFEQVEQEEIKKILAFRMNRLINQLEKHNLAIRKSMLVPVNII
jgi:hypothetical protein